MKKRGITIILAFILVFTFLILNIHNAAAAGNVCCEKLKTNSDGSGGQFCMMAPQSSCNLSDGYQSAPTSCGATQFCQIGTCVGSSSIPSQTGQCTSGVSRVVCQNDGGYWESQSSSQLQQCQLGCCYIGTTSALFTTQVACKQEASTQGVSTNWDSSITSESACLASAGGDTKGACVYQTGGERTCTMTTKTGCTNLQSNGSVSSPIFYPNDLCSNENLHTNCGPSKLTTCVPGQDAVYFVDTCGNIANVYDASKVNDLSYWQTIIPKSESCGNTTSNANSASCGNCDFGLGSTCAPYQRGTDPVQPTYGNYICKSLSCNYQGKTYQQGESWCALTPGTTTITDQNQNGSYTFGTSNSAIPNDATTNLPGSVYEKLTCMNGQVTPTFCGDGRQQICVQDSVPTANGGTFSNAACELNKWQDCYNQTSQSACLDRSKRDCQWLSGNSQGLNYTYNSQSTQGTTKGACAPLFAPGFDFYNGSGHGDAISGLGSIVCNYKITTGATGTTINPGSECVYLDNGVIKILPSWVQAMNTRCTLIGDSGPKENYLGLPGQMQIIAEKVFGNNVTAEYVKANGNGTIFDVNDKGVGASYSSWTNFVKNIVGAQIR